MEKFLPRIDLNLLRALHTLLEERSVTRAAERLFITQSAMSKSLLRLREVFGDPLFQRTPHGLVPTPRALELTQPLQQIFDQVEHCLAPAAFDPAMADGVLRIAAPEQFALAAIPGLLMRLQEAAPKLKLESLHLMDEHVQMLASGNLDFVINLQQSYPGGCWAQPIYSAAPMLWCRRDHPLAKATRIELADIFAHPQITFRAQNITRDESRLMLDSMARTGLELQVILDTSHLLIAIDVLVKTDAMMLGPDYLSQLPILQNAAVPIAIGHLPLFDKFLINLSLVRHERTRQSPLHNWIAREVANLFRSADGVAG